MKTAPLLLVIGTRPEAIKMAPVYFALKNAEIPTLLCSTMQHDQLLLDVLNLFAITPDIQLNIMRHGQDLFYITQSVLQKIKEVIATVQPALIVVQGDTTSAMAASLAAFYANIPVAHIEAGLRTDDIQAPFPEEMNRRVISVVTAYHFAPTPTAVANILAHGIRRDQIFCTGNTIVDALRIIKEKITSRTLTVREDIRTHIEQCKKNKQRILVLTLHRRESFNGAIDHILHTINQIMQKNNDLFCVYAYHPNPHVIQAINRTHLNANERIYITEPLAYHDMVYLLDAADIVLTDSGGIQEEAVSLGKPVIVLREKTERMEGVLAGLAHVVGFDSEKINRAIEQALSIQLSLPQHVAHTFGDGYAADKIVAIIKTQYPLFGRQQKHLAMESPVEIIAAKQPTDVNKKICILGLGYIGLPTAIIASSHGFNVIGVDVDEVRVQQIMAGDPVIQEPLVYERLQLVLGSGHFRATTIIESADFFIIAVPTPITHDKKANVQYVFDATNTIATVLKKGDTVIVESTVPVGITDQVADVLAEKTGLPKEDFFVVHCPERVLPGNIMHELVHNDRILGGINERSVVVAKQFYKQFVRGCLYLTDAKTAEMVKLIENSSRDAQLAFAHQVASMAVQAGLSPYTLIELANKHPRVKILRPTCGVGGHCIAVDPWFLVESFPEQSNFIKAARQTNDAKPYEVIASIKKTSMRWQEHNRKQPTILLLGLTYKPDVDDLRESPALHIAQELLTDTTMQIRVHEPYVKATLLKPLFGDCLVTSLTDGISQADIVVFLVAHQRFSIIDKKLLHTKQILDFCGVLYQSHEKIHDNEISFWPAKSMVHFNENPLVENQQRSEEISS